MNKFNGWSGVRRAIEHAAGHQQQTKQIQSSLPNGKIDLFVFVAALLPKGMNELDLIWVVWFLWWVMAACRGKGLRQRERTTTPNQRERFHSCGEKAAPLISSSFINQLFFFLKEKSEIDWKRKEINWSWMGAAAIKEINQSINHQWNWMIWFDLIWFIWIALPPGLLWLAVGFVGYGPLLRQGLRQQKKRAKPRKQPKAIDLFH